MYLGRTIDALTVAIMILSLHASNELWFHIPPLQFWGGIGLMLLARISHEFARAARKG